MIFRLLLALLFSLVHANEGFIAPAAPVLDKVANPFITASFTYWKLDSDFLFASSGYARDQSSDLDITKTGEFWNIHFDFEPGFKAGAGLAFEHGGWDLFALYTWFHTNDSRTMQPNRDVTRLLNRWAEVGSTLSRDFDNRLAFTIHAHQIDLELGRDSFISPFFTMRPHFGLKGILLDHTTTATYKARNSDGDLSGVNRAKMPTRSPGFGIRAGINVNWYMTTHFSVVGKLALTNAWLFHDCEAKETETVDQTGLTTITRNQRYNQNFTTLVTEYFLGFMWDHTVGNCNIALSAAWESQVWERESLCIITALTTYNEDSGPTGLERFSFGPRTQPFAVKGLTVTARLSF